MERALGAPLENVPDFAVVFSVAMTEHGDGLDAKVDLCGHCLAAAGIPPRDLVARLAREFELDPAPYHAALGALTSVAPGVDCDDLYAFVGIGVDAAGQHRINVYLKAPTEAVEPGRAARPRRSRRRAPHVRTREALERSVGALASENTDDGLWRDFTLPVGRATFWSTAYVGNALLDALPHVRDREPLVCALERAAGRLRATRPDALGYNEHTDPDADSIALGALFLGRLGEDVEAAREALLAHQAADGGFATFRYDDHPWGQSHADVTPTAMRALLQGHMHRDRVERAAVWLLSRRREWGRWRGFWWRSDLYAAESALRALALVGQESHRELVSPRELRADPGNAFESALRLRTLLLLDPGVNERANLEHEVGGLLSLESRPGRWAPGAWLRVPIPGCEEPWLDPDASGKLYLDSGLFTAATVVTALADYLCSV